MADAAKIAKLLLGRYPEARLALDYANPLELLVAVILSAQCTDVRVNQVTCTLFRRYRSARDYAQADTADFEQEIRPTGFYKSKARSVTACCRMLVAEFGGEVPRSLEELVKLPGVGRKTANMVLGNAFGTPAIAVDTHVLRVANRLGLVTSDDPDEVEAALTRQFPRAQWTRIGNALILHGRETCRARNPDCAACVLYPQCRWKDKARYAAGTAGGGRGARS